jgi:hypothetical protein
MACIGAALIAGCGAPATTKIVTTRAATLPAAISNNAVALVEGRNGATIYSFNGLLAGKTPEDVTSAAFACDMALGACREIGGPPVREGRLASAALTLGGKVYLFGGYSVAEDGSEVSTPEVFAYDPYTEAYARRADLPVPVDDAVAFAYAGRYIYLVSGWRDDGNVSLVQVFDADENRWFRATDYPGAPVFGHAGGAVEGRFVIADGVAVVGEENGKRKFGAVDEAWLGEIDENDPAQIAWRKLPPHPGGPLYRMAAAGDGAHARVLFYGGGDNPYNYDGVGYDGAPAKPSSRLFAYDLAGDAWIEVGDSGLPSMDHRGLMISDDVYYVAGGMIADLALTDAVTALQLE